jgi:hypothetical protein
VQRSTSSYAPLVGSYACRARCQSGEGLYRTFGPREMLLGSWPWLYIGGLTVLSGVVLTLACEHAALSPQPANSAHRLNIGALHLH